MLSVSEIPSCYAVGFSATSAGVNIALDNGVELQNLKTDFFCLHYTVQYELFADMPSSALGAYSIACVTDMPAPTDVVGVQDI